MSLPTTPLKFPLEGKPIASDGNWTPVWQHALQGLFTRVGAVVAPSNLQLAAAISTFVAGPTGAVSGDIAVFNGTTGLVIKDSGIQVNSLMTGPGSSVNGDIAVFNGITGGVLKDSSVQISSLATNAAISQLITGPVISVVGDIATFNNTTGTVAADSGVLVSSLAPIASPTFTGTPKAPTATAGTNTTQLASTAFVTTAVAAAGTTSSSFSAHNNGVAQSIPNVTATQLTFSTTLFNNGSNFASSAWTPPGGRVVMLVGAVTLPTVAGATSTYISIYKNGSEFKRGVQVVTGGSSAVLCSVTCIDVPSGTDVYTLYAVQLTGSSQNTFGTTTLTYFQGTSIQS